MPREKRNSNLTTYSQQLRTDMTKEERHLWYDFLKKLSMPIRRQYVIGSYIADFYIPSAKIVIELDGSEHYEPRQAEYDTVRNEYMATRGITVLRYTNLDINTRFGDVCGDIMNKIGMNEQG